MAFLQLSSGIPQYDGMIWLKVTYQRWFSRIETVETVTTQRHSCIPGIEMAWYMVASSENMPQPQPMGPVQIAIPFKRGHFYWDESEISRHTRIRLPPTYTPICSLILCIMSS